MLEPRFFGVPEDYEDDPERLGNYVSGNVGNILEAAAVWYSLLYFVQIEQKEELSFELSLMTQNLSKTFLWYIVAATHTEYWSARDRYYVDGEKAGSLSTAAYENHMKRSLGVRGLADIYYELPLTASPASVYRKLDESGVFSNPVDRCLDVEQLFAAMVGTPPGITSGRRGATQLEERDETGWMKEFNGDAWEAIAAHGADHEDPTPVAWVDQTFSVEHNNGNFFDKTNVNYDRLQTLAEDVYDTSELGRIEYRNIYLPELLDRNHSGDMSYVIGLAAGIDEAFGMGLNLADHYADVGAPDGPLMQGEQLRDFQYR
jgi:hypothetical protein